MAVAISSAPKNNALNNPNMAVQPMTYLPSRSPKRQAKSIAIKHNPERTPIKAPNHSESSTNGREHPSTIKESILNKVFRKNNTIVAVALNGIVIQQFHLPP